MRRPLSFQSGFYLEGNAPIQLECARSYCGGSDSRDRRWLSRRIKGDLGTHIAIAIGSSAIGKAEARMVQDVRSVHAKLDTDSLGELEILAQREVDHV